mmetsp:Transcript_122047/g.237317  ORF Transcript_122047/g.237317 Transcript_122047/m.237317 type:complete len:219 (-) Transcript_122047:113-769(-)
MLQSKVPQVTCEVEKDEFVQIVEIAPLVNKVLHGRQVLTICACQELSCKLLFMPKEDELSLPLQRINQPCLGHYIHVLNSLRQKSDNAFGARGSEQLRQRNIATIQHIEQGRRLRLSRATCFKTVRNLDLQWVALPCKCLIKLIKAVLDPPPAALICKKLVDVGDCNKRGNRLGVLLGELIEVLALDGRFHPRSSICTMYKATISHGSQNDHCTSRNT